MSSLLRVFLKVLLLVVISGAAFAFGSFKVQNFRVQGLQKVSKDAVLQEIPFKRGQTITSEDTTEMLRALFKTGFFQDVSISKDGDTLVIKVKERPSISKVNITGIKNKDDVEKILKESGVGLGRFYEPTKLAKAEQELERHYLIKGRYGVKISSNVVDVASNKVDINLSIYEGDEAKIKSISIVGNKVFTEKQLKKDFLHKPTGLLSWFNKTDRYAKEKLAADLERLRSYYMDRGYVNFQVDSTQVSLSTNKKEVHITINVSEGDLYRFSDPVILKGKFVIARDELQKIIEENIKPSDVFSRQTLWDTKEQLESRLGEDGYSLAQAKLTVENDDLNKLIKVEFFIEPGKRVTVRRINITGNNLTEDIVLRRGLEQMEGSWISTKKIREGKEYMQREGYAGQVEVTNKPVLGKEDQVDVNVKIEEQRTAQFSAGIAYSAADNLMFNLGADFKNFLGTGKSVNFSFDHSRTSKSYSLGYFNPYFTKDGIGMGYNVYYRELNLSKTSNIFEYSSDAYGADVNWSLPINLYDSFIFGAGVDRTELKFSTDPANYPREVNTFVNSHGKKFDELTASFGWRHNSLDTYIFPTSGISHRLAFKLSLPNSDLKYYQAEYDINYFRPITKKYILQLSGDLGYKASYKGGQYFPFFKHYFAGGADTVRGYEERSLGPLDSKDNAFGGNVLAVARASFIFPPPFNPDTKSVRTALFLDAGQVYDTNYKNRYDPAGGGKTSRNPQGLRYSVGLSLTWHMPLGIPMSFSLAKPLNAGVLDKKETFTFSIATSFM